MTRLQRYDHVTSAMTTAVLVVGYSALSFFAELSVTAILLAAITFYVLIYAWHRGVRRLVPFLRDDAS